MAKATLKSISKEAGVSVSTISRVLNNYTDGFSVKPEIRQRIMEVVARRNYRPSPILRTMRAKRTMLVAFIHFGGIKHFFTGVVERALFAALNKLSVAGYQVSMNLLTVAEPENYVPQFPVDGVVVSDVTDAARLARLEELGIPYVSLNGVCGPKGVSIQVDEAQCAELLMKHLRELGHERIVYCHGLQFPKSMRHPSVPARLASYEHCMRAAGLEPQSFMERDDDTKGMALLNLALEASATAVVAYDHYLGVDLLHAAYLRGVETPKSLSVVCFNDEYPAALCNPALTCAALPAIAMGETAASLLLRQMRGEALPPGQTILCEGELVVRSSSAPVRSL
jgi:LacI family transcriptional regulator